MKKILLGTGNRRKVSFFEEILNRDDVHFLTLSDLNIQKLPDEDGMSPKENAMKKAAFYGQFADRVISQDAGLYFIDLPLDDPRQPGLFVRRAPDGHEMTDEEMIAHFSSLVHSLGGKARACYLDGWAVSFHQKVTGFMQPLEEQMAFAYLMLETPHKDRHPGWPLDSLSADFSGRYWMDQGGRGVDTPDTLLKKKRVREEQRQFLIEALALDDKGREENGEP